MTIILVIAHFLEMPKSANKNQTKMFLDTLDFLKPLDRRDFRRPAARRTAEEAKYK